MTEPIGQESRKVIAAKLKEEGNAHFAKKEYKDALNKYTEAIKHDEDNAILYSNRAACSFALGRYLDSAKDARKATSLDPTFPRGWVRLANAQAALSEYESCIESWESAIKALPTVDLSPEQSKQKQQYSAALDEARKMAAKLAETPIETQSVSAKHTPWIKADELIPGLMSKGTAGYQSSAWVISEAAKEFNEGVGYMKELQKYGVALRGHLGALTLISNGVIRDKRVFHVDCADWFDKFNQQVIFTTEARKAVLDGGSTFIIEHYKDRQQRAGWDDTRPALATTVRVMIMKALVEADVQMNGPVALEYIQQVLEILKWGNTGPWRNVPVEEKGVVFSMTFIRKVQVMYLDYYTTSHADDPGHHNTFPLSRLREEAEELITELQSAELPSESTPSHLLAFYIYPLGHAFAALGFYHAHMIELVQPPIADIIALHLRMAADLYLKAADTFPVDDELHPYFLSCAVNYSFKCGTPIRDILPLMERIRNSIPETKKIWEHSATYPRLQKTLDNTLRIEDQMRESLRKGEFTLEDAVIPQRLPEDAEP